MKIQLALDRFSIDEAIQITQSAQEYVDWIEVGTSLIKEYGKESIQKIKTAFPNKTVVADCKTIDNARYEFEMCFQAGADVATVMGVAPAATIKLCMETAEKMGKKVMVDLLNTTEEQQKELFQYKQAIFCNHVSKDEQETQGKKNTSDVTTYDSNLELAVAGGISLDSLHQFKGLRPAVFIIGSAITKASSPGEAAREFKQTLNQWNEEGKNE